MERLQRHPRRRMERVQRLLLVMRAGLHRNALGGCWLDWCLVVLCRFGCKAALKFEVHFLLSQSR